MSRRVLKILPLEGGGGGGGRNDISHDQVGACPGGGGVGGGEE